MNSYKICCLYSGSKGNSTYIEAGDKKILIDAGKNSKALCASLKEISVSPDELDAIFVTHEHNDHVSALRVFSHHYNVPIHIMLDSAKKFQGLRDEKLCACLNIHTEPTFSVDLGGVTVTAFPTPHDARASVGYRIEFDGHAIAYATDIGYVTDVISNNLLGCEAVVVESNHDTDMLIMGSYPYELKERILSRYGHLSNNDCAELCAWLAQEGTKNILLAHLSEENNTPELAYNETLCALAGAQVNLRVASQDTPVWLVGGGEQVTYDSEFYNLWCKGQ